MMEKTKKFALVMILYLTFIMGPLIFSDYRQVALISIRFFELGIFILGGVAFWEIGTLYP